MDDTTNPSLTTPPVVSPDPISAPRPPRWRGRPLLVALICVVLVSLATAVLIQAHGGSGASVARTVPTAAPTATMTTAPTATAAATATVAKKPTPTLPPTTYKAPKVVQGGGSTPPPPPPPAPKPPAGPDPWVAIPTLSGQLIVVNIAQQWLWAYQDGKLVYRMPVTTGMPQLPTPTGHFSVQWKESNVTFISPWPKGSPYYYSPEHINYALYFADDGYYLHDAPWRACFGPGTNVPHTCPDGTTDTGSHGCVNMPTSNAAWLYNWAHNGARVYIVNVAAPQTPTPTPTPAMPTPTPTSIPPTDTPSDPTATPGS